MVDVVTEQRLRELGVDVNNSDDMLPYEYQCSLTRVLDEAPKPFEDAKQLKAFVSMHILVKNTVDTHKASCKGDIFVIDIDGSKHTVNAEVFTLFRVLLIFTTVQYMGVAKIAYDTYLDMLELVKVDAANSKFIELLSKQDSDSVKVLFYTECLENVFGCSAALTYWLNNSGYNGLYEYAYLQGIAIATNIKTISEFKTLLSLYYKAMKADPDYCDKISALKLSHNMSAIIYYLRDDPTVFKASLDDDGFM